MKRALTTVFRNVPTLSALSTVHVMSAIPEAEMTVQVRLLAYSIVEIGDRTSILSFLLFFYFSGHKSGVICCLNLESLHTATGMSSDGSGPTATCRMAAVGLAVAGI